mgnify:CR=1 FL=1
MEKWQVALLSSLCTLVSVIMVIFIYTFMQSGVIEIIKEELVDDYCSSIPLTEARDLEVCND